MFLGTWGRYGQSKFANIAFARELHRRHPKIASVVVHPGVIATKLVAELGFWKRMFVYVTNPTMMTVELGPGRGLRGKSWVYEPVGRELWEWTETEMSKVE